MPLRVDIISFLPHAELFCSLIFLYRCSLSLQTVDFDAQDDSFMAKHLVEAGTQDIAVGTPIFVTVDDADSVAAFKDFEAEAVQGETEAAAPAAEAAPPTPEEAAPAPAAKKEAPPAPEAATAPAPAPAPAPTPAAPVEQPPAPVSSPELVFKRDWGSGVRGSALAHRWAAAFSRQFDRRTVTEPPVPSATPLLCPVHYPILSQPR